MAPKDLAAIMAQMVAEIPEIEHLSDTTLLDAKAAVAMIEQAREILMIRNLQAIEQVNSLQQSSDFFQTRAAERIGAIRSPVSTIGAIWTIYLPRNSRERAPAAGR